MAVDTTIGEVWKGVPPDYHPDTITGELAGDQTGRSALEHLYNGAGKVLEAMDSVNDKGKLHSIAKPLVARALKAAETSHRHLGDQWNKYNAEINANLNEGRYGPTSGEVRDHFKGLKKGAFSAVRKLIDEGEKQSVAAVLGAPFFLSGLTREEYLELHRHAANTFVPELVTKRDASGAAEQRVGKALTWFRTNMTTALDKMADTDAEALKRLKEPA